MWNNPILTERILNNDNFSEISLLLSEIFNIEWNIEELLNSNLEKDNPIYDSDDFEISILKTDLEFLSNKWCWYMDYNQAIYQKDLQDWVFQYQSLLLKLMTTIKISLEWLIKKTNEDYKNFFRLKSLSLLDELNKFEYKYDSELQNVKNRIISNPYKILFDTYVYYSVIISNLNDNINDELWNFEKQAKIISVWLNLNIDDFENLKKWEDNIEVNDFSINNLIKNEDWTLEVENILKWLWVKTINPN